MNIVLNHNRTEKLLCSCGGKHTKASDCNAFVFDEANRTLKCPECGKELVIIQTPAEKMEVKQAEAERKNRERLKNLHMVEAGSDWECGMKYYQLSANIEHEDWLKVKEHFKYYNCGWSDEQELEWESGEPTGWLTTNPKAVEDILVESGLIKPENAMNAISERVALEKEQNEKELAEKRVNREKISREMENINEQINNQFANCANVRRLSDAEAHKHYFNPTFGKGNVVTYTINNSEIIKCMDMGDFKTGIAIPYDKKVEKLIKEYYELNEKFWEGGI
ncbi:hypothetical protein [uncultured Methanobrevibacter sp.]|uniref:hypothetical protein n=1 Tax=uncultured Methanobrevibacter sp. TaxID=253161 RepID=UPI0026390B52|nr:hypothetical protein [uncultured Methanobrevibacter sp.]